MSVRGQVRGRGGRGRGAGRGRRPSPGTMIWEWENYSPGPEVYDSIFHVREAPPTITPTLPDECPLPILQAESRILDRRETDDKLKRWYYVVLIRAPPSHPGQLEWREKKTDVDISRILRYVSPRELERFENARFREEAEVEAVVKRAEEEERARRRLMRNEKPPVTAFQGPVGHGSGRGRGRARGRGRGRGRGRRQVGGRVAVVVPRYHLPGKINDEHVSIDELAESEGQLDRVLFSNGLQRTAIAETDSEQEQCEREEQEEGKEDVNTELIGTTSPFAHSSFVSNSALPLSPTIERMSDNDVIQETEESEEESPLMRSSFIAHSALPLSPPMQRTHHPGTAFQVESSEEDDEMEDDYAASQQLLSERLSRTRVRDASEESAEETRARQLKRRRTESAASLRSTPAVQSTKAGALAGSEADLAAAAPTALRSHGAEMRNLADEEGSDMDGGGQDDEEYAIEAILSHTYQDGVKFYLVKWEGYGEATDWLPEEDLAGAREMVAEYDEKVRRKKGKKAVR